MKTREMDPATLRALADEEEREAKEAHHFATTLRTEITRCMWADREYTHRLRARRYRHRATRAERAWRG